MFRNIYPIFEKKHLLKKEMLENLRDYPRNLFRIQHQDYSDGILLGCELESVATGIIVLPGILYYKGIPYFLEEACTIPYKAEGKLVYLKVCFPDKTAGTGQEEYLSQVYMDGREPDSMQELELARFKLQPGARLRTDYVDFYDYTTEFDTVNRIHVPYAAPKHHGIWPQILKCFAKTLMHFGVQESWDYAFCMSCLQLQEAMPYEAVQAYLNIKLRQENEYTNIQIYNALKRILQDAKGKEGHKGQTGKQDRKLLML